MICYRRLKPFKVISFDLDDTLYDNLPIIRAAEKKLRHFLFQQTTHPSVLETAFWDGIHSSASSLPLLSQHSASEVRRFLLKKALISINYPSSKVEALVDQAFNLFYEARSDFTVSETVLILLEQLAIKYPLVAITNGNVDLNRIGIRSFFKFSLHAGKNNHFMKPSPSMFNTTYQQFNIGPEELLHIGDSLEKDSHAVNRLNSQSIWLNTNNKVNNQHYFLPTIEISAITEINALL